MVWCDPSWKSGLESTATSVEQLMNPCHYCTVINKPEQQRWSFGYLHFAHLTLCSLKSYKATYFTTRKNSNLSRSKIPCLREKPYCFFFELCCGRQRPLSRTVIIVKFLDVTGSAFQLYSMWMKMGFGRRRKLIWTMVVGKADRKLYHLWTPTIVQHFGCVAWNRTDEPYSPFLYK
jgi:hypothetical protein